MYYRELDSGEKVCIDPLRLSKLEFPFFNGVYASVYFLPGDKMVVVPMKFGFKSGKNDKEAVFQGELVLPREYPRIAAKTKLSMDAVCDALLIARKKDWGLHRVPKIKKIMETLGTSLKTSLKEYGTDFIFLNEDYNITAFMVREKSIIGIAPKTRFTDTDNELRIIMYKADGPYKSLLNAEDRQVRVVLVDNEGVSITEISGELSTVTSSMAILAKKKSTANIRKDNKLSSAQELCEAAYEKYHDNFHKYFSTQWNSTGTDNEEVDFTWML